MVCCTLPIFLKRINHPAEVLTVGQNVKVQVIRFNEDNQRISLGMKQLENDPWQAVADKYNVGEVYTGKVTNITDYVHLLNWKTVSKVWYTFLK